ncbi:SDR family NAD(P)-dependent oxidoreductase [Chthonobacter albigriseus]|uniref:SDR family NAD(P)-dependent oxidoreductase n=1 Tax=Chthonobacter albigriseus TaxID=1683161 RepID=UPI0015EE9646|nr:SDR family NAD(P)-dependent oxidoreductase [Chthonobacter albigriseus]
MDKRIAVVTGASRGIGRAAALALAQAGCHVVAIARTEGGLTELDDEIQAVGGSSTLVPMSVTDGEAIDRLGGALFERYGRVDALLANAGILGPMSPLNVIDPKKWDEVFAVNVTANWRLIRSLDPLLRQSAAPRALFVSSGAAHKCRAYWGPYSASKAALEALVRTYAHEVETFGIKANLVNPGPLRTRMRAQAMPGEDPLTLQTPEDLAPHIVAALDPAETRTGLIYDFPSLAWLEPRAPEPVRAD